MQEGRTVITNETIYWPVQHSSGVNIRRYEWRQWFEGDTIIGDKSYKPLHFKVTDLDDGGSVEYTLAYMREEFGKVYMRSNPHIPIKRYQQIIDYSCPVTGSEELLVMDFNLKKWENMYMMENPSTLLNGNDRSMENPWTFKKSYYEKYDETVVKVMELTNYSAMFSNMTFYEMFGTFESPIPFPQFRFPWEVESSYTVRVEDDKGNIIFDPYKAVPYDPAHADFTISDGEGIVVWDNTIGIMPSTSVGHLEIYDTYGNCVLRANVSGDEKVDISSLNRGIYIAVATIGDTKILHKKFVR